MAAARNAGIYSACGKWLYFVDSDDWLESGGLEKICEEVRRNPHADMIFMEAYENTGHREKEWVHFTTDTDLTDPESIRRLQGAVLYAPFWNRTGNDPMAAPWDKVYRRDFLTENHLRFCERLRVLDDMVFNFEVLGAARHVACRKVKPHHYHRVPDSITNSYKPDRVSQDMEVWKYLFSLDLWGSENDGILQRASMLPLQGADIVLQAIALLEDEKDIFFQIIGPIPQKYDRPVQDNVEYIDWLEQEELAAYIANADLCLAGHFNAAIGKAHRTIPGKAYIYEAMGKRMVLGDSKANHERYDAADGVYWTKMGDADALAGVIVQCCHIQ